MNMSNHHFDNLVKWTNFLKSENWKTHKEKQHLNSPVYFFLSWNIINKYHFISFRLQHHGSIFVCIVKDYHNKSSYHPWTYRITILFSYDNNFQHCILIQWIDFPKMKSTDPGGCIGELRKTFKEEWYQFSRLPSKWWNSF